jgi:hypothetical protein
MNLISISAHYQGDGPNGLNVSVGDADCADLDAMFQELRSGWDRMWRSAVYRQTTYQLVQDLVGQLERLGSRPRPKRLSTEDALLAIANIDLLERIGHLKPDDFNGMMLVYSDRAVKTAAENK